MMIEVVQEIVRVNPTQNETFRIQRIWDFYRKAHVLQINRLCSGGGCRGWIDPETD